MLYSGLDGLNELIEHGPASYVCFGDDFNGYSGCFEVAGDGTVHEFDSATCEMTATGLRFQEFIARYIA